MALTNKQKQNVYAGIRDALVLLVTAVMMIPILWIAMAAFKTHVDVYQLKLFFTPTLKNFETVFQSPYDLHEKLFNSTIVAFVTVLIAIPLATMAAYSFSLYLTHFTVLSAVQRVAAHYGVTVEGLPWLVAVFVLSNIIALFFYWAFERHYRQVRHAMKRLLLRRDAPHASTRPAQPPS